MVRGGPKHKRAAAKDVAFPPRQVEPYASSRFLELSKGNLKHKHWQVVVDIVSSRDDYTRAPKSDTQCKNRIDTLKKKYKLEKSKIMVLSSSPPYYSRGSMILSL